MQHVWYCAVECREDGNTSDTDALRVMNVRIVYINSKSRYGMKTREGLLFLLFIY